MNRDVEFEAAEAGVVSWKEGEETGWPSGRILHIDLHASSINVDRALLLGQAAICQDL